MKTLPVYMSDPEDKVTATTDARFTARSATEPLHQKSDEVLITQFQNGDRNAFRALVERYQERVRNLVFSIFQDGDLVNDVAQDVFIKAYEGLRNFRFQSSFYTWLYRITVNRCRDELRKRKVRKLLSLQSLLESSDKELIERLSVEPRDKEMQEIISKTLQALPDKYRIPVILKDINGLSYEEIAETMQCEIGTVKSRLSRARSMLRKTLRPFIEEM